MDCTQFVVKGRNTAKWRNLYEVGKLTEQQLDELRCSLLKFEIHIYQVQYIYIYISDVGWGR